MVKEWVVSRGGSVFLLLLVALRVHVVPLEVPLGALGTPVNDAVTVAPNNILNNNPTLPKLLI